MPSIFIALMVMLAVTSCDSLGIRDSYDECILDYSVKFKYDYNMKYADAFANEVTSVTLFAFDKNGKFVFQKTEAGSMLAQEGYTMSLNELTPGTYQLICWAGLGDNDTYSVPKLGAGDDITTLTCKLERKEGAVVDTKITPLWYGYTTVTYNQSYGIKQEATISLVKNTNKIRVILQQIRGSELDVEKFEFKITDANGYMNWDNTLLEDDILSYYPYQTTSGSVIDEVAAGKADDGSAIGVAIAQFKIGRLVYGQPMRLVIKNKELNRVILSIPLIKFLELTEAEGHHISTQEYLDRQDEYALTLFLDQNLNWITTHIVINDWIVRFNDLDNI